MLGFPGAPRPGPFLLFSPCKQTHFGLVISPRCLPIKKKLPLGCFRTANCCHGDPGEEEQQAKCAPLKAVEGKLSALCGQQNQPENAQWEWNHRDWLQGTTRAYGWWERAAKTGNSRVQVRIETEQREVAARAGLPGSCLQLACICRSSAVFFFNKSSHGLW